jgi:hypothetical protein
MGDLDHTTKREAVLTQTSHEGSTTRAQYRWNTGELSQITVPSNFFFDPRSAVRPKVGGERVIASEDKVD